MSATLIYVSPKINVVDAIRTCYLSEGDSDYRLDELGEKDLVLIRQIIKSGHESCLEHSLLTFEIEISRACLQQLSRHRVGVSPSVQSTRYTLKKIIREHDLTKYIRRSGSDYVDMLSYNQLLGIKEMLQAHPEIPNDVAKYAIPESLLIKEMISFNWRSLRHFLSLRTDKKAHDEIKQLADEMIRCIPESCHIFIEEFITDK